MSSCNDLGEAFCIKSFYLSKNASPTKVNIFLETRWSSDPCNLSAHQMCSLTSTSVDSMATVNISIISPHSGFGILVGLRENENNVNVNNVNTSPWLFFTFLNWPNDTKAQKASLSNSQNCHVSNFFWVTKILRQHCCKQSKNIKTNLS